MLPIPKAKEAATFRRYTYPEMTKGHVMKDAQARVEVLMKFAEFQVARWESRRSYEWKITLAYWAAIAASPLYIKIQVPWIFVLTALGSSFLIYVFFFIRPISNRNTFDILKSYYYMEMAEFEAGIIPSFKDRPNYDEIVNGKNPLDFIRGNWGANIQIYTTAALCVISFFLIMGNRSPIEVGDTGRTYQINVAPSASLTSPQPAQSAPIATQAATKPAQSKGANVE